MSAPRLEIRLDRVHHNARTLVEQLAARGVRVTAVTKATLGSPEIARELLAAGATAIGESRIENIEALRAAGVTAPMTLIRSPMLSQVDRVVAAADTSLNSESDVLDALSVAARLQDRVHGVVLMVELGDLREGILPADLAGIVHRTLRSPNLVLHGIGTNLACQSGVVPDERNMSELSALAASMQSAFNVTFDVVSGGNSANLDWALGGSAIGAINELRLGESILLGREPQRRRPIEGLHTDAIRLVAEVIEAKRKPTCPRGALLRTAFGARAQFPLDRGDAMRVIVALGHQDVDPAGLTAPPGYEILGASSDHLVLHARDAAPAVGTELTFGLDYGALLRAMSSPFVSRSFNPPGGHTR